MRGLTALCVGFVCLTAAQAHETKPGPRFGIEADLKMYPQGSPKETLASLLKALDTKRIDYVVAHLADPKFVDARVETYGGNFEEAVKEAKAKLLDDPGLAKQLRQFLEKGEWTTNDATAHVRLKEVADRWVYLRKADGRWFLENRWKPSAEGKEKKD